MTCLILKQNFDNKYEKKNAILFIASQLLPMCRHLARISKLPVFLNSSAHPKLSTMAKMAFNGVKWLKMVLFCPSQMTVAHLKDGLTGR